MCRSETNQSESKPSFKVHFEAVAVEEDEDYDHIPSKEEDHNLSKEEDHNPSKEDHNPSKKEDCNSSKEEDHNSSKEENVHCTISDDGAGQDKPASDTDISDGAKEQTETS